MNQTVDRAVLGLYQSIDEKLSMEQDHKDRLMRIRPEILNMYAALDPARVDYLSIRDLKNEDFFFALYLGMCRRPPSETDVAVWKPNAEKWPKERFQQELVGSVARSEEVIAKGSLLDHYGFHIKYDSPSVLRKLKLEKSRLYEPLHDLYMKLPIGLRIIAKRIKLKLGRW